MRPRPDFFENLTRMRDYMPLILTYIFIIIYIYIVALFVIYIFLDSHVIMYDYHQNEL